MIEDSHPLGLWHDLASLSDVFFKAKFWESAHPALNEWAADGSYDSGSFIADAAEGFVFDGGLHWLRPLRMFLGKASKCQFLCCFFSCLIFLSLDLWVWELGGVGRC